MPKILLSRVQMSSSRQGFDITARTKLPVAPNWDLVLGYKSGLIGERAYTEYYLEMLNANYDEIVKWLETLPGRLPIILKTNHIIFKCFCPDRDFCHTNILIDWLLEKFPDKYEDARIEPKPIEVLELFKWMRDDMSPPVDLYTVVLDMTEAPHTYDMLCLGEDCTSPQGFSQFSTGLYYVCHHAKHINDHLGTSMKWSELPKTHRKHIIDRLKEVDYET